MLTHLRIDFLLCIHVSIGRLTFYLLLIDWTVDPKCCVFEYLSFDIFCLLLSVIALMSCCLFDYFPSSNRRNKNVFVVLCKTNSFPSSNREMKMFLSSCGELKLFMEERRVKVCYFRLIYIVKVFYIDFLCTFSLLHVCYM